MRFKYQMREPRGLIIPKGPSFNHAELIRVNVDDTEVSFRAPKHDSDNKRLKETRPLRRYQAKQMGRYFTCFGEDKTETPNHIESFDLFLRRWTFYGPWFSGPRASLKMSMSLIMAVNFDRQFSMYHPRVFEKFVGDYLTLINAHSVNLDGEPNFEAPVNWQPLAHWSVPAARLEVVPTDPKSAWSQDYYLFFSLSDRILASVRFTPSRYLTKPRTEVDKHISEATMLELMNQIMDSFELQLSDDEKQRQQAALAGLEDTSVINEYPPLDWSTGAKSQQDQRDPALAGRAG